MRPNRRPLGWLAIALLTLALAACGTSGSSGDTSASGDTSGTADTGGTPNDTSTPPDTQASDASTQNPNCPDARPHTGKDSVEVSNVKVNTGGNSWSFTCSMCPGGYSWLSGRFKYYENDDPGLPNPSAYRESLTFDGNLFENVLEGIDSGTNQSVKAVATGYFFCPSTIELTNMASPGYFNVVLVYQTIEPAGAFGINANDTDLCFLGYSVDPVSGYSDILIRCNTDWSTNGTTETEAQYCKVNAQVQGKLCSDPF
ncbi:MAG: hypothetical protein KC609_25625 [Myxococcales bacterium]|nr:hypothetical protein [Myxococcales bacterium]